MMLSFDSVWRLWRKGAENAPDQSQSVPPAEPSPPREAPWLARLDQSNIPRHLVYPSTTLGRILDQSADRFGDSEALLYNHHRWTYRELLAAVNRMAGGLAYLGVRRGERVLLVLPNCPEFVIAFLAIQKLGAIVVNAGPLMGLDDLKTVIGMTNPRVAICLDLQAATLHVASVGSTVEHVVHVSLQAYQPVLKRLGYQIKLWHNRDTAGGTRHTSWTDLLARAPARPPTVESDPSSVAVLQATGGTTGTLKLAQLTHASLLANVTQVSVIETARAGQERCFAVLPMFHVYGLTLCLITSIFTGSAIILMTRFNAGEMLELLRRHKPTICPIVPAICDALCALLEKERKDGKNFEPIQSLRLCISGAAPLPRETAERFYRLTGAKVIEGYGLTEASPVTHAGLATDFRAGSIGLPLPDTRCRIVELEDPSREVQRGEPGELLIAGPQLMTGYFGNPEQTQKMLIKDGKGETWLRTGDIARMDADGFFYLLDRKKDMIIRSGLKVYPGKVERVIRMHQGVRDAAVVGRPDPHHTEMVVAVIAPAPPEADRSKWIDELRALCREHLAVYEVPQQFEFLDALPRSALGKLLKRELRKGTAASNGGMIAPELLGAIPRTLIEEAATASLDRKEDEIANGPDLPRATKPAPSAGSGRANGRDELRTPSEAMAPVTQKASDPGEHPDTVRTTPLPGHNGNGHGNGLVNEDRFRI